MRRLLLVLSVLAFSALWLPAVAMAAADDIPGTPTSVGATVSGTLDMSTKPRDVYAVSLRRGEEVNLTVTFSKAVGDVFSTPTCLFLMSPSSKSIVGNSYTNVASGAKIGNLVQSIDYTPAVDGAYFIDVTAAQQHGLSYGLSVVRTAAPAITDPWAPDIFGIAVGAGTVQGVVDLTTLPRNVFAVRLFASEPVNLTVTFSKAVGDVFSTPTCLFLMSPSSKSIVGNSYTNVASGAKIGNLVQSIDYTPAVDGTYFIDVTAAQQHGLRYSLAIAGSVEKPPYPSSIYIRISKKSVKRHGRVTISGSLVDQHLKPLPGKIVSLQRSPDGKKWMKIGTLDASSGRYSASVAVTKRTWFRTLFTGDGDHGACSSRRLLVKIK